jgi:ABC-type Fe3+/spermidine/putrescine transport system ATPase subunit
MLELDHVTRNFGDVRAVDGVSFGVERGQVFTLLGPSGCGKTTTLRMIAGLERVDSGRISVAGTAMVDAEAGVFVQPHARNMGMVFQSYAIWPHMTVFDNVAYPLTIRHVPRATINEKVARVLELVGMQDYAQRPSPLLSGGQQQRVALSRALVYEPHVLLLDEPFSNLDAKLRQQMRVEVRLLQRQLGITVIFVTHDQDEALGMSDRIAIMNHGRIEQMGPPSELYDHPASPFVRDFLGQTVVLRGKVAEIRHDGMLAVSVESRGSSRLLYSRQHSLSTPVLGQAADFAVRPRDVAVVDGDGPGDHANQIDGTITALLFLGEYYEANIELSAFGSTLLKLPRSGAWTTGQRVCLELPSDKAHIWPA